MKVLHVINSLILAGTEVLLSEMLPRLRQRGIDGAVFVLKHLDSPLEINLRAAGFHFLPSRGSHIYSPSHISSLAKHISSFDIVHSYLFPAQLWVAMAGRLCNKCRPLVTAEPATYNRRRRRRWGRHLDVWMYRNYGEIVCNSKATAESLIQWVPEVADRVSVVYNGVPIERFQNAEAPDRAAVLPTASGRPVVMFVARFDPSKDHSTLLHSMRRVPEAELVLVGDGDSRPAMQTLARDLGIRERVHFLGRRADVPELLKLADLYVQASNFEGFGVAAVEAMSAGLPVIATDVPGLNEVVKGTGVLVPSRDEEALAGAIRQVLQSEQTRQRMAAASRERAMEFGIDRMVESFVKIYQSAVYAGARADAIPLRLT
jgi:glycosyltransferase involved in cell wall biosynthesis